jgi:preprotein translocase subunit SecA
MFTWAMRKIFGTSHERAVRRCRPKVDAINALEAEMKKLSDAELKARPPSSRRSSTTAPRSTTSSSPRSPCAARPARVLKMRHYDVQLIGGMVLHRARSPRCAPARARRSSPPCPAT